MNKYLGVPARVLLLLLVLSIIPAAAHADSFVYTVTSTFPGFVTSFSFTQPTIASSGDVTSLTQISGTTATLFLWDSNTGVFCSAVFACARIELVGSAFTDDFFPVGSFLAPGTYTSVFGTTVNITQTQTGVPEPSSLLLLGSGILSLFGAVRRKLA